MLQFNSSHQPNLLNYRHKFYPTQIIKEQQQLQSILPAFGQLLIKKKGHLIDVEFNSVGLLILPNIVIALASNFNCSSSKLKQIDAQFLLGQTIDLIHYFKSYKCKRIRFTTVACINQAISGRIAVIELYVPIPIKTNIKLNSCQLNCSSLLHLVGYKEQPISNINSGSVLKRVFSTAKFKQRKYEHLYYIANDVKIYSATILAVINQQVVFVGFSGHVLSDQGGLYSTNQHNQSMLSIIAQFNKDKHNNDYFQSYDYAKSILQIKGIKLKGLFCKFDQIQINNEKDINEKRQSERLNADSKYIQY